MASSQAPAVEPVDAAKLGLTVFAPVVAPAYLALSLVARRSRHVQVAALTVGVVAVIATLHAYGVDGAAARHFAWHQGLAAALTTAGVDGLAGHLADMSAWRVAVDTQWPAAVAVAATIRLVELTVDPPEPDDRPSLADRVWRRVAAVRHRGGMPAHAGSPWNRRPAIGRIVAPGGSGWERGSWAVVPADAWAQSAVVAGATGSGKTMTLLAFARAARRDGRKVFLLDFSGDAKVPVRFVADMLHLGVDPDRIRTWPQQPVDAWRAVRPGDLADRLHGLLRHDGWQYFENLSRLATLAAVDHPDGMPTSAAEFVARLHRDGLRRSTRWATLAQARPDHLQSVSMQYRSFFEAVAGLGDTPMVQLRTRQHLIEEVSGVAAGAFDGDWSWGDCDAAVLAVNALGAADQAAAAGRLLLRDLAYHATSTKPDGERWTVVIDEFAAIHDPTAVDLVERLRKFDVGVILGTQSVEDRGFDWSRVLAAGGTVVVHRTAKPDQLIALAGTVETERQVFNFTESGLSGSGQMASGHEFVVDPNDVRRLPPGVGWVVSGGMACKVRFDGRGSPDHRFGEARRLIEGRVSGVEPATVDVVPRETVPAARDDATPPPDGPPPLI